MKSSLKNHFQTKLMQSIRIQKESQNFKRHSNVPQNINDTTRKSSGLSLASQEMVQQQKRASQQLGIPVQIYDNQNDHDYLQFGLEAYHQQYTIRQNQMRGFYAQNYRGQPQRGGRGQYQTNTRGRGRGQRVEPDSQQAENMQRQFYPHRFYQPPMDIPETFAQGQVQEEMAYNQNCYPGYGGGYYTTDPRQTFDMNNQFYYQEYGQMQQPSYQRQPQEAQVHSRQRGRGTIAPQRGRGGFSNNTPTPHIAAGRGQGQEPFRGTDSLGQEMYRGEWVPYYHPHQQVYVEPYPTVQHFHQQSTQPYHNKQSHTIHRRQYGTFFPDRDEGALEHEEKEQVTMQAQPLTKGGRVLRRGRGKRSDQMSKPDQILEGDNTPTQKHYISNNEEIKQNDANFYQNEDDVHHGRPKPNYKIVSRQGGRGHRGSYMNDMVENRGDRMDYNMYQEHQYPPNHNRMPQNDQNLQFNQHQGPPSTRGRGRNQTYIFQSGRGVIPSQPNPQYLDDSENFEAVFESEEGKSDYLHDFERYDDFDEEVQYTPKPTNHVKYTHGTFDDVSESSASEEDSRRQKQRRGPKIIKFKQKKPSERIAASQMKNDSADEKDNGLDVYSPLNTQTLKKVEILRSYPGFEKPEFFQGPSWKYVRQSTNQNSKQKHYETGEYDKVQYNFPGAENEDKDTDGEIKLYPPIDDFSDEDVGIDPSSSKMRLAKISFRQSPSDPKMKQKQIPQNIQNLMTLTSSGVNSDLSKNKSKKPAVSNKPFNQDKKKKMQVQSSDELQIIPGLIEKDEFLPISMENAENFFLKGSESQTSEDKVHYFEDFLEDQELIKQNLEAGVYFKGKVMTNPKLQNKAYIYVPELDVNVMINGFNNLNRSMDGDTVVIKMLPVHQWFEMTNQTSHHARITTLCPTTGQKVVGINNIRQADSQAYTNENAIEHRVVDGKNQLSPSHSEEEREILNKQKPKKFQKFADEDGEGYNADNNIEKRKKNKKAKKEQENLLVFTQASKLSLSDSEQEIFSKEGVNQGLKSDLWEDLEQAALESKSNESTPRKMEEGRMTMDQFLGHDELEEVKEKKGILGREIRGTKEERINQINEFTKTHRPLAKIVFIEESPMREVNHICCLIEVEKSLNQKKSIVFARPANKKLPWMFLKQIPEQMKEDKEKERNPGDRYYLVKFQEWKTNKKRATCTVIDHIGEAGNLEAESLRILRNHDICTEMYDVDGVETVHECLKVFTKNLDTETNEWKIPEEEIKSRLDLRDKRIFSIDPSSAKDIDDALSIDKISDRIYEIGVHIADVSFFVQQGSDLDKEALKRGTSTYFVQKVFPMLPKLLSNQLCSLNPNVDRLTYSIFFRMDLKTGKLDQTFEPKIHRSVIRSCAKWNYDLVQDILEGKIESEDQVPADIRPKGFNFLDCAQDVLIMNRVAQARRKKRFQEGSLEFRNRDFTFILNEATSYPVSFTEQERRHSKQLVEEYMLMANVLIGRHLLKYCEDKTILRAHDEIKDQRRDQMLSFFQKVDLDINMTDALSVSQSIKKIASEPNSEDKLNVINRKFLTSLKQARYVCVENLDPEDFDHFGLNFEIYTHFTSPIRRYADLLVHRLLTITLKEKENTRSKLDGLDYSEYAKEISDKSYNSKRAARDCEKLFHCLILKDFGHQVYDALITDVDYGSIGFYIHDLNMHFTYKLRDDKRIDELTFFEDDLIMAVNFKKPLNLALDIETYEGDFELNKSDWFKRSRAKEEQKTRREEEDQRINPFQTHINANNRADLSQASAALYQKEQNISENCVFRVFGRIKVKIEATKSFPLDLSYKLLITEEDIQEYSQIEKRQKAKKEELRQIAVAQATKLGSGDATI